MFLVSESCYWNMTKKKYQQSSDKPSSMKMQDFNVVYQQTTPYVLTEVEHDLVMRSEEDYKAGRIYTQAEVDKLVATWLH